MSAVYVLGIVFAVAVLIGCGAAFVNWLKDEL